MALPTTPSIELNPCIQMLQSLVDSNTAKVERDEFAGQLAHFLDNPSTFYTFDYFETLRILELLFQRHQNNPEVQIALLTALGEKFSKEKAEILALSLDSSHDNIRTQRQQIFKIFSKEQTGEKTCDESYDASNYQERLQMIVENFSFHDTLAKATENLRKIEAQEINGNVEGILNKIKDNSKLSLLLRQKAQFFLCHRTDLLLENTE